MASLNIHCDCAVGPHASRSGNARSEKSCQRLARSGMASNACSTHIYCAWSAFKFKMRNSGRHVGVESFLIHGLSLCPSCHGQGVASRAVTMSKIASEFMHAFLLWAHWVHFHNIITQRRASRELAVTCKPFNDRFICKPCNGSTYLIGQARWKKFFQVLVVRRLSATQARIT